jgi:hypothetical protein
MQGSGDGWWTLSGQTFRREWLHGIDGGMYNYKVSLRIAERMCGQVYVKVGELEEVPMRRRYR